MKSYTHTSDPAHGWIGVPRAELEALGIAHLISPYSYSHIPAAGPWMVYLEEDQDATIWLLTYKRQHGHEPAIEHKYVNTTRIRRCSAYAVAEPWESRRELAYATLRSLYQEVAA